jgi:hypothetical protein
MNWGGTNDYEFIEWYVPPREIVNEDRVFLFGFSFVSFFFHDFLLIFTLKSKFFD